MSLFQGYSDIDKTRLAIKSDAEYQKEFNTGLPFVTGVRTELHKSFSFWPAPDIRTGDNIYDMRSYRLKPGKI